MEDFNGIKLLIELLKVDSWRTVCRHLSSTVGDFSFILPPRWSKTNGRFININASINSRFASLVYCYGGEEWK